MDVLTLKNGKNEAVERVDSAADDSFVSVYLLYNSKSVFVRTSVTRWQNKK